MKFAEASLIMKTGEIFRPFDGYDIELRKCGEFEIKDGYGRHITKAIDQRWMCQDGEIVPVEPKELESGSRMCKRCGNIIS